MRMQRSLLLVLVRYLPPSLYVSGNRLQYVAWGDIYCK